MQSLMEEEQLPAQDYRELYRLLLAQLRVVEAEEAAVNWVAEEPDSADALLSLGLVQLTRNHAEALNNLELASALDSGLQPFVRDLDLVITQAHLSDDGAYQQLLIGRELSNQGYPLYAEILIAQAVKMNPQYAEAWAMLGELQQQNGRSDGFTALQTAVELDPDSTLVQSLMAIYWQRQGDPTKAMAYYEQLSAQQPEEFRWQVELAKATADAGDIPAGYEIILAVGEDFADETQVWIEIANFCAAYGMDVSTIGLDAAREALSRDEDNVDALTAMGNVFFALSDFDSAQRYYDRGIDQEPESAMLHYMLGRVYLEKENTSLAVYHLELAQALTPSYSTLYAQIERTLEALEP
jgi:tetratricopeptide (TPR) repeat protein